MKKILTTLLLSFFMFACGASGSSADGEKVFSYNVGAEGASLDPARSTDESSSSVIYMIQEGLTRVNGESKQLEPALAESWDISEDGLTYTFHLKKDLKWSDGSPLTAKDVEFSWKRVLNPETAAEYAYMLYPIANAEAYNSGKASADDVAIKALDDVTLEVKLGSPTAYFLGLTAYVTYFPVSQAAIEKFGSDYALEAENMVYSGAFTIADWEHNSSMSLVKNPSYHDADKIKLDKISLKFISDTAAALNAYNNDELDLVKISSEQIGEYKDSPELTKNVQATTFYLQYNTKDSILSNAKIRKALGLAIDKEVLVTSVLNGVTTPAYSLTPKNAGILGLEKDFIEEMGDSIPKFNADEAKKLLAEGLKELGLSELPKISLIVNDSGSNKKIGENLKEQVRVNLGVDLEIELMTFKERLQRTKNNDFQVVLAGWGADFLDPINFLELFESTGGNNHGKYSNPVYDEAIRIARSTPDKVKRIEALRTAEKLVGEDAVVFPLFNKTDLILTKPNVSGVTFASFGNTTKIIFADKAQ